MDQFLTIPVDRKPQNQMLLCALMGVTLLLLLCSFGGMQQGGRAAETAAPASAPVLLASK